jgi:hypothetical protein
MTTSVQNRRSSVRLPFGLACTLLAAIALYFLWDEHEAHIRGALPYLLLLACPLLHLFGHGSHSHASGSGKAEHEDCAEHHKAH